MNSASLSASSNVTIYVKDKHGKVTRRSQIHNKATIALTEGLLRFLEGDFTPSKLVKGINRNYNVDLAMSYLPAVIRFGNIGVTIDRTLDPPVLTGIDSSVFRGPTFYETKLQQELQVTNPLYKDIWDNSPVAIESTDFTGYTGTGSTMGLALHAYAPIGNLVGLRMTSTPGDPPTFLPYTDDIVGNTGAGWAYWNQSTEEWETILTEIGLYSNTGNMLARVILDGEINLVVEDDEIISLSYVDSDYERNPIVQSETSSILIEWKINLVSAGPYLGPDDDVYALILNSYWGN